jgi:hypothetical protein
MLKEQIDKIASFNRKKWTSVNALIEEGNKVHYKYGYEGSQYFINSKHEALETQPIFTPDADTMLKSFPKWLPAERKTLVEAVPVFSNNGLTNWDIVSKVLGKRSAMECLMQYRNVDGPQVNKNRKWERDEEMKLLESVELYKEHNWCKIAQAVGNGRTPFQCLQHYQQSLNKAIINTSEWSPEEDSALIEAVKIYGIY